MKRYLKGICFLLLLVMCILFIPQSAIASSVANQNEGFLTIDTDKETPLPKRFRIIPTLNISGSAQFIPSQIDTIKKSINVPDTYIVDLRQESHGFLNNIAVNYYSPEKLLNEGFTSEETLANEKSRFEAIKPGDEVNLYNKQSKLIKSIKVETSQIEPNLAEKADLKYVLFATRDGHIPTPEMVDSFVEFVKNTPSTTHLHFHCKEGQGRTTTFMSLFQMMKESTTKSLDEILNEQLDAGGIVLTDNNTRAKFLQDFYNYTKANVDDNFKVPFSVWSKQ
ncbi:MAG: phosphatase [Clostridium sp.]|uniref:fused DSP-PTPase phosphatase/NAD kinase-like protein n=1 Tax=Clostridium sp. TaxID=1506 RepID=UPI0030446FC5